MFNSLTNWLWQHIVNWLNTESKDNTVREIFDFDHLLNDVRPADVVLVEGQAHVSEVIKIVTMSPWTHAALAIGSLDSIKDHALHHKISQHYQGDPNEPLVIESLLGHGTVVNPLSAYRGQHLRICRPVKISLRDRKKVCAFALEHLGLDYDVRQLLDLARLMFPYAILPRKWRSSLFSHNAGKPTQIVCSSMIARCFQHVQYPVLPIIKTDEDDQVRFYKRNFRLFVPADFDYSPFFDVIKYPSRKYVRKITFNKLPWCEIPTPETPPKENFSFSFSRIKNPFAAARRQ